MAMTVGYSGTPLAKKLGIKEGMTVLVVNAPADYAELVAPLPEGVTIVEEMHAGRVRSECGEPFRLRQTLTIG